MTDSKQVKAIDLCRPKGERHDALASSARRCANAAIASSSIAPCRRARVGDDRRVRRHALRALGDLAHYRPSGLAPTVLRLPVPTAKQRLKEIGRLDWRKYPGRPVVAGRVAQDRSNFNNLVACPADACKRLTKRHKFAVVELGTNSPCEIQRCAEIADPYLASSRPWRRPLAGLKNRARVARERARSIAPCAVAA